MAEELGKAKYDEKTLMQMRFIEVEKRLKELEGNQEQIKEMRRVQIIALSEDAETRIKTLEDARQRQIILNKEFLNKPIVTKPSFWELLFKKK